MGAMRKMAVYLGLVEDDPDAYPADEPDAYEQAVQRRYAEPTRGTSHHEEDRPAPAVREVRTVPRTERPAPRTERLERVDVQEEPVAYERTERPAESYRITTLHPRSYNDARRIGEEFRQGVPVIINLTEMDDVDAKRIVDFSAGLIFGRHGSIERVTNKVFLLSPDNVDVAAEARRLAQDGFFNQS